MGTSFDALPRLVRPVQEPLGLYLRPGRNDHRIVSQLLSEGRSAISGLVLDPEYVAVQEEIRTEIRESNLEAVLDTRLMEVATPAGCTSRRAALPWGDQQPHTTAKFSGIGSDRVAESVAEFVVAKRFTAVLSPTHFLADGTRDRWFDIDRSMARKLRECLDKRGAQEVAVYYPLAIPTKVFFDSAERMALKSAFEGLPIDALWLRVHPFGSHAGHLTLQRYIAACRDLHSVSFPLVAEKTGSIGLALLAFGGVGGIETGVSSGEKFDFNRLSRARSGKGGFAPHQRVYFPTLGIFLPRDRAEKFLENRSLRASFGCCDTACCRRGAADMVRDPRRHFVYTRMEEVKSLARVPPDLRAGAYLDRILRPVTDKLGRAIQADLDDATRQRFEEDRRRLDGWRYTLGEMARAESESGITQSAVPRRRALRQQRGA